jgi:hypothetical protein
LQAIYCLFDFSTANWGFFVGEISQCLPPKKTTAYCTKDLFWKIIFETHHTLKGKKTTKITIFRP